MEPDLITSSHGSTMATMARSSFTLLYSVRRRCRDGLQFFADHRKWVDRAARCAEKRLMGMVLYSSDFVA